MTKKQVKYQRKSSQHRRHDLIAAGIRCLGEGGMSNFTIDKICKQANVSRGLINHHFKSKDDLLLCIYDNMTTYLVVFDESKNADQRLISLIHDSFDSSSFEKSNLRAWLAIWGEVATRGALKQLHESRYQVYHQNLSELIGKVAGSRKLKVDATAIARQLIALIDGLWLEYCLHSEGYSLETAANDCFEFLQLHLGTLKRV